jgi:aquaporin NIP
MNPARSLGPAIVSGQFSSLWIYVLAPIAGAMTAVPVFNLLKPGSKVSDHGSS